MKTAAIKPYNRFAKTSSPGSKMLLPVALASDNKKALLEEVEEEEDIDSQIDDFTEESLNLSSIPLCSILLY